MGMDGKVWGRTVFCINRGRLLDTEMARHSFRRVLQLAGQALFTPAAYNLTRLLNLMEPQPA
jgi:hypothetical protein